MYYTKGIFICQYGFEVVRAVHRDIAGYMLQRSPVTAQCRTSGIVGPLSAALHLKEKKNLLAHTHIYTHGSDRGHKNAGRARLRVVRLARHRCFMADSFVCSAVGIIFPSKLRYTWNNGEIKT